MKLTEKQKAVFIIANAYGIGQVKGKKLLESLKEIERLSYDIPSLRKEILCIFGEKEYREICVSASGINFDFIENKYKQKGVGVITIVDDEYPETLRCYDDAPLILYYKGNVELLKTPCFGVVGTRFPTKYGIRVTEDFVAKLSKRFTIVSGMARGIDSCAHRTTLNEKGNTIAVLGCGVDVIYPPENRQLYHDIVENGLIISEYDIGENANSHNFPARNRIISGLSRAILITEAGEKSGTILTLNYALEQGKDVFCVPGSIYNKASMGCNKSILACQTRAVTDVNDIYKEIGMSKTDTIEPSNLQLDINEDIIVNLLAEKGELHFEEIMQYVDLSVPQLNTLLIKMTAIGIITKTKNNYWSI